MKHDEKVAARFWAKVDRTEASNAKGCWLWEGALNPNGSPSRKRSGASCYGRAADETDVIEKMAEERHEAGARVEADEAEEESGS